MRSVFARVIVLAGALVAVLSAVGASSASAATCINIGGAGSSLQKVAQESVWTPKWLASECSTKTTVTYKSTSSGNGKKQWGSGGTKLEEFELERPLAAFIGSDTAASPSQMENMSTVGAQPTKKAGIVAVPVAQSAITQMISLPEGCTPPAGAPEVVGKELAQEWEKDLISFATLTLATGASCSAVPSLLARSSNSGTTAGQKHYFDTLTDTPEWLAVATELTKAEEPLWPSEANSKIARCCEKGSQLVLAVYDTPGTMGYADLGDSASAMAVAWSKHTVGSKSFWSGLAKVEAGAEFVSPEAAEGESNCGKAAYEGQASKSVKPGEDWSTAKQNNVNSKGVYPVCTLTFDLAWHKYETAPLEPLYGGSKGSAEATANTVRDYLHWIVGSISDSGQNVLLLKQDHYGKLPSEVQVAAEKGVTKTNIE